MHRKRFGIPILVLAVLLAGSHVRADEVIDWNHTLFRSAVVAGASQLNTPAQEPDATSVPVVPSPQIQLPDIEVTAIPDPPPRVVDRKFVFLGVGLVSAMSFDLYSTYRADARCPRCREDDPFAAPFISRGPGAAVAAGALFDAGVLGLTAAMRHSSNPALRHIWWLPSAAVITGHALAIRHNLGVRQMCQTNPSCGR
jgi:hypothetical protein